MKSFIQFINNLPLTNGHLIATTLAFTAFAVIALVY